MGSAYFIVPEDRPDGLDYEVNGKFVAKCPYLDGLAHEAGVRPLLEFFSSDPEEAASLFEDEESEEPAQEFPPEAWFEAADGLVTVRGLIGLLEQGPVNLPEDPVPNFFPDLPAMKPKPPRQEDLLEDLREFEVVLARLDAEKIRWHLDVDF